MSQAFLSWLRAGVGAQLDGAGDATSPGVMVSLAGLDAVSITLALAAPEHVEGIDPRVIVRTWPKENVFDGEPNFLACIEFTDPDLPWRFSPRSAAATRTPWLALIVLADSEIGGIEPPTTTRKLPVVSVAPSTPLPPLDQLAAWAHVHVVGDAPAGANDVANLMRDRPQAIFSRVLCSRRMSPRTSYTAFLVPSFKRGALGGAGAEVPDSVGPSDMAWTGTTAPDASGGGPLRLPVYYQWRFGTGTEGDFEVLVRKLQRRALPDSIGTRALGTGDAGGGLPEAPGARVESALAPAGRTLGAIDDPGVRARLVELLNVTAPNGDPVVTLPLYGRWHAARSAVADRAPPRAWFDDLNLDIASRVAASLGSRVVRQTQQALMASAWQQVESIRRANDALRAAQLARGASQRMHERFAAASPDTLFALAGPLRKRVLLGGRTVATHFAASVLPHGLESSGWRRLSRPLGPVALRQTRLAPMGVLSRSAAGGIPSRILSGSLRAVPTLPPSSLATLGTIAALARGSGGMADSSLLGSLTSFAALRTAPAISSASITPAASPVVATPASPAAPASFPIASWSPGEFGARPSSRVPSASSMMATGPSTGSPLGAVATGFRVTEPPRTRGGVTSVAGPAGAGNEAIAASNFRTALRSVLDRIASAVRVPTPRAPLDLHAVHATLASATDPRHTIPSSLLARIDLRAHPGWRPADPLEPIMAAPEFPQPMYEPLRGLSNDWILGGLGDVPTDSIVLLEANRRFLEAYMVGLNHEMARELLWAGYPTDQRGSYFRQFWDARGIVTPSGDLPDPETVKDIQFIHAWRGPLGGNPAPRASGASRVVLLIRGEIVRRYPRAAVYLARLGSGLETTDHTNPVFEGHLPTDVAFYGFPIDESEITSSRSGPWYFVIEEQTSATRFGFEVEAHATGEIAWSSLGAPDPGRYADLSSLAHAERAGETIDGAFIARSALRQPVRLIIPAAALVQIPAPTPPGTAGGSA